MPSEPPWAEGDLGPGLLDLVLAKQGQAEVGGGADDFRGLPLGDGQELDRRRIAAGALAGASDALAHRGEVVSQRHRMKLELFASRLSAKAMKHAR